MKPKNQNQNNYSALEKVLAIAGLALVILGCIANLYGALANQRFMNHPGEFIYYYRYIILLGGGLVVGAVFARNTSMWAKLYQGSVYAVLAMAIYLLFDLVRLVLRAGFGEFSYISGMLLFLGAPVLALVSVLIVAYFAQYRYGRPSLGAFSKGAIISLFLLTQIYVQANAIYYRFAGISEYSPQVPVWLTFAYYLTIPLVIALVAYFLLPKVTSRFDRLFFSSLIGSLYSIFLLVVWEFHKDTSAAATTNFGYAMAVLSLVYAGVIIWRSRLAVR